jgi:hypothetical protein
MNDIKDIRHDLIQEIMHIEDLETLNSIYNTIEKRKKTIDLEKSQKIEHAIVEVKKRVDLGSNCFRTKG